MTDNSILLDSSVWLSYFLGQDSSTKEIIETKKVIMTSVLSLFEIKRKLLKENKEESEVEKALDLIKNISIVLEINEIICENAAKISIKNKLHTMDSLIYATAILNNALLLTFDSDFKNLSNVRVL